MLTTQQKTQLDRLTAKYRYSFSIYGSITNPYNTIRLAAFVNLKAPTEYESFQIDDDKTLVFYNVENMKVCAHTVK
jgi:dsDNA-specific endonuclease/ATPase MutS2